MGGVAADAETFNAAFGRELKAQRARRALPQSHLVDPGAGLSLATVRRVERGAGR